MEKVVGYRGEHHFYGADACGASIASVWCDGNKMMTISRSILKHNWMDLVFTSVLHAKMVTRVDASFEY